MKDFAKEGHNYTKIDFAENLMTLKHLFVYSLRTDVIKFPY